MKYVKTVEGIKLYEKQCEGFKCTCRFLIPKNHKQRYCSRDCRNISAWSRNDTSDYKKKFNPQDRVLKEKKK